MKSLRLISFIANMAGAYYFVDNFKDFLIMTSVILINFGDGFLRGKNIDQI